MMDLHLSNMELDLDNGNSSQIPIPYGEEGTIIAPNPYANFSPEVLLEFEMKDSPPRDPLSLAIPMTVIYSLILISGLIGNISTCIVIARTSYMHTATNYYLFSLAMSDLLLLISGFPQEICHIWIKYPYIFGEAFCVVRGLAAETSANATVLTITAFTVERFVAIVYPLKSHKLSQLSRVVRMIVIIWVVALCLALPQAAQFGVKDQMSNLNPSIVLIPGAWCTLVREIFPYAFQISIFVFFLIPMTIITILYILIGLKLRQSRKGINNEPRLHPRHSQGHVIRMLVAVVVAFGACWLPHHCQRLLALYLSSLKDPPKFLVKLYHGLDHISGVLYYTSTCINPILYHIMSNKFRQAFKDTLSRLCGTPHPHIHHRNSRYSRSSYYYSSPYHYQSQQRQLPRHSSLGKANSVPLESMNQEVLKKQRSQDDHNLASVCICQLKTAETTFGGRDGKILTQTSSHCPLCGGKIKNKRNSHNKVKFIFLSKNRKDKERCNNEDSVFYEPTAVTPLNSSPIGSYEEGVKNVNGNGSIIPMSPLTSTSDSNKKGPSFLRNNKRKGIMKKSNKCPCEYHNDLIKNSKVRKNSLSASHSHVVGEDLIPLKKNGSHCSINSNHTNTISNSSLQDLDEGEYTSEELAGYMKEINMNLDSPPHCSTNNSNQVK